MRKKCMDLFKNEIIRGEINIYDCYSDNKIFTMHNVTIEKATREIVELLKHTDYIEYISDKNVLTFDEPKEENIAQTLIYYEASNLMKDTEQFNEDDSRTHLYANIIECVNFIKNKSYIDNVTITHQETFLMDEEFTVEIFDVDKYGFTVKVNELNDFSDFQLRHMDFEKWNNFWNNIYKRLGA